MTSIMRVRDATKCVSVVWLQHVGCAQQQKCKFSQGKGKPQQQPALYYFSMPTIATLQ